MNLSEQIIKTIAEDEISMTELMQNLKQEIIAIQLQQYGYNITATAESLRIPRTTLHEILRRQGLNKVQAAVKYETESKVEE